MTDPIDGDGGRDDDYEWERDDEIPSTRDQLARLRDGLSRSGRGGEDAGGELPGSLDRAIARVGGLFDEVGPASAQQGVRDPYADFGEQPAPDYAEEPYETPERERAPRKERPRRAERQRASETSYERGDANDLSDEAEERRRAGADRRERRAARSRKAGYSYDDSLARPDEGAMADGGLARDDYAEEGFAEDGYARGGRGRRDRAPDEFARDDFPRDEPGGRSRGRDEFPAGRGVSARDRYLDEAPNPRRRDRRDAGWEEPTRRGRQDEADEPGYAARRRAEAPGREAPSREAPERSAPRRAKKSKAPRGAPMEPAAAEAEAKATRGRGSAPFGSLERMLAGRYLRARRKEGFISVIAMLSLIGITLAVAVLIVVMSVMNGFRAEFVSKIVGVNGHLIVQPFDRNFERYDEAALKIRAVAGVTRAAPLIEGQAFATSSRQGVGVLVRGVSKADLLSVDKVAVSPESSIGSLANFGPDGGIAIGEGLAGKLGVSVGDSISVISPQGSVTPFGTTPKRRIYEVSYVFKIGMSFYDNTLMFMPISEAKTFFNRPNGADFIEVQVATPDRLDGYADDIRATAGEQLTIRSWKDNNGAFIGALETEQSVMFLILSMLILIASLIIISGLIMLVKEKGPDIAILRTMGLSRAGVMRVFFMCGATVGLVGCLVGVGLGVAVALNISDIKEFIEASTGAQLFPSEVYLFSRLPSRLDWNDVGFTVLITLGLSFVATLYPAWRAARMDPVEALRYE